MKKSLIALAVLAASGAAMAQSSVTLYGKADVAIVNANNAGMGYVKGTQASANGALNFGNSRLGVRGVEDLGGGLKTAFQFEQGINIANGATDAVTWQRAAYVALQGGFGELYAGRRLSPHFFAIANYELTDTANWSALANQFGFGGETRNTAFVGYTTPNLSGFSATIGTTPKNNNAGASKTNLNLKYNNGPLAVGLGYDKTQGVEKSMSLGASYDFKAAKVAVSLQDPSGAKKGYTLGVKVPFGQSQVVLDIARDNGTAATKNTDYVLEYRYNLSKRTFVYGAFYRNGAVAGAVSVNAYSLGIDHNF